MKMNKKGFTLIELLAVVTIMGILMLVAIPAIARTIENTRRDTFNDTAKKYINAVRNEIIADQLKCGTDNVGATPAGYYYFLISTKELDGVSQETLDLLESGGKSSWGKSDVKGAVVWHKTPGATDGYNTEYFVLLVDAGNHGISTLTEEGEIKRSSALSSTTSTLSFTALETVDNMVAQLQARKGTSTKLTDFKTSGSDGVAVRCTLAN